MVLGAGHSLKIRDLFMDFEPYFKVHNLVSVPTIWKKLRWKSLFAHLKEYHARK